METEDVVSKNKDWTHDILSSCYYVLDLSDQEKDGPWYVDKTTLQIVPDLTGADSRVLCEYAGFDVKRLAKSTIPAKIVWEPHQAPGLTLNAETAHELNTYQLPWWDSGKAPETAVVLPDLFGKFLKHLTAGEKASYDYVLDYLSYSLRAKCYQYLTLVGEGKIGKGTLWSIIYMLAGGFNSQNARKTDARVLKDKFNSQAKHKTHFYLNEISVSSSEQFNQLKNFVDPYIEVEGKGVDAQEMRNHASVFISANIEKNRLDVGWSDRRFSIVRLTETPLTKEVVAPWGFESVQAFQSFLESDRTFIGQLGNYLKYFHKIEWNMDDTFVDSEYKKQIMFAMDADYISWLDEWAHDNPGKAIDFTQEAITEEIEEFASLKIFPRKKIIKWAKDNKKEAKYRVFQCAGGKRKRKLESLVQPLNPQQAKAATWN